MCRSGDDPDPERCNGLARGRLYRHAPGLALSLMVQETLKRDPMIGHLFVFRGRSGG
ncbi:hypothetical protein AB4Z34_17470 [Ensifer sp. 2YAB10]|uniref:hypothetical protein n=1 Tax=unclassified Ensifer TaxID=2633371 RepID=UPI003F8FE641